MSNNDPLRSFSTRKTPQSGKIPGSNQVENSAGGFAWSVDDWSRLNRFLILGTDGGTYYIKQPALTVENAQAVLRCIEKDGKRVVDTIVDISIAGRAPKNDPALFALAMCAGAKDADTRKAALEALPRVARIGTHLFHFAQYVEQFRGWGRSLRRAVGDWYNIRGADDLAYQLVKYQQRDGWSHGDLLRLSHPKPSTATHDAMYKWVLEKDIAKVKLPQRIFAFGKAKNVETEDEIIRLIGAGKNALTREMIPTKWLNNADVWEALLNNMPLTAMIRNLGKMSAVGLLKPMSQAVQSVVSRLGDKEYIQRSRIHPLGVLVALKTYEQGYGVRGSLSWSPVPQIVDALDKTFYLAFGNVEPTGKRIMLCLDVSGSMAYSYIAGMPGITPMIGAAAMALVTAKAESQCHIMAFSHKLIDISISPRQRLDDVVRHMEKLDFGRTDCALPMVYALNNGMEIDTFVIYTDSETWFGDIHPAQALAVYREKTGIDAKLIVVGMMANEFSIADPNDPGMLDVVGFDTATPNVISEFSR